MGYIIMLELAIIVVVIVVVALVAYKFESIAEMKGHEGYFWWCFWLGPVGWAMVIALPDRRIEFPDYSKQIASITNYRQTPQPSQPPEDDDNLPEL